MRDEDIAVITWTEEDKGVTINHRRWVGQKVWFDSRKWKIMDITEDGRLVLFYPSWTFWPLKRIIGEAAIVQTGDTFPA